MIIISPKPPRRFTAQWIAELNQRAGEVMVWEPGAKGGEWVLVEKGQMERFGLPKEYPARPE